MPGVLLVPELGVGDPPRFDVVGECGKGESSVALVDDRLRCDVRGTGGLTFELGEVEREEEDMTMLDRAEPEL